MEYEIRLFDKPLLRFNANPQAADAGYEITWVSPEGSLLPYGLAPSPAGLSSWIKHRVIPKNRAFVDTFLARNGLNANRPLAIVSLCKGLSLNDCYWVAQADDGETFDKVNLYDNRMSRLLAQIALTGHGSAVCSGFASSPEFTTNGMLPKCWRRKDRTISLWKGGTTGFANSGYEPYSEYYAADIARSMGVDHVDYELHTWNGLLCSTCELFTSKERSFIPVSSAIESGGFDAVCARYRELGPRFEQALSDMLAFDAIICNTDRHLGNFGFMTDSATNAIMATAPLFDHGNALFHQAYGDDWSSAESLEAYAAAQTPCLYDDFFTTAKELITRETQAKVRLLLDFSFSRKAIKGFPAKRLALIEQMVRKRAALLLE